MSDALRTSAGAPNAAAQACARAAAAVRREAWITALACTLVCGVALGIGRFAFTPLLPKMIADGWVGLREGGWLASANYAGYFIGAVSCAMLRRVPLLKLLHIGLTAMCLLLLGMALHAGIAYWLVLRAVAGMISAWLFIFSAQWGMRRLAALRAGHLNGLIYGGSGVAVAITGALAASGASFSASVGWIVCAAMAALFTALVWRAFERPLPAPAPSRDGPAESTAAAAAPASRRALSPLRPRFRRAGAGLPLALQGGLSGARRGDAAWLVSLYSLSGFGYVITATFLPLIAHQALPHSAWPDWFWPLFGVAIVPGALLAAHVSERVDNRLLLGVLYLVQGLGVLLSVVWPTVPGFATGVFLVGVTFNAIALYAMREARRIAGDHAAGLAGYATAGYGLGQIMGPIVGSTLALATGSFSIALLLAAAVLWFGGVSLLLVWSRARRAMRQDE